MPCFSNGDHVHWRYRAAIGSGNVTGVHVKADTCDDTEYSIHQLDHHEGEDATVYHYGRVLKAGYAPGFSEADNAGGRRVRVQPRK